MRTFLTTLLLYTLAGVLHAADYIWIEAEQPDQTNMAYVAAGWGNKEYLSEEEWLHIAIVPGDIKTKVPEGGGVLAYNFTVTSPGTYEVWNRIGFEFVRSPFEWRIDDGEWRTVTPEDLTTDLMILHDWCEVAWLKLGRLDLAAGDHTFQVRLAAERKPERLLYSSDAILLCKGAFLPNGPHKPDEDWQSAEDRAAADTLYTIAVPTASFARAQTVLTGLWQIARFDENEILDRTGPVNDIGTRDTLHWKGIMVPGDKNALRPEMLFCHRYLYRTRVYVPEADTGRGFFLHFPSVNMIATVFVNGQQCGWTKAPFAIWDCDITPAIVPGATNEIVVAIKDTYYGLSGTTRKSFNFPLAVMHSQSASMRLDFPVWNHIQNGILEPCALVVCGPVYTADVFARPSVARKALALDVTLHNPGARDAAVTLANAIVPLEGGAAEKVFATTNVMVPAGGQLVCTLSEGWENPRLWWPDDPQQYLAVTRISASNAVIDTLATKFGFREWTWNGPRFHLNGVPWQGRADLVHNGTRTPEEAEATWKRHGQTMVRFWATSWAGMTQGETLDFHDAHGMPVRRSGIFDGEMASYGLSRRMRKGGQDMRVVNQELFDNWIHRMKAWVRGERNHPSIFIWSMENEVTYINALNLGQIDVVEPEITRAAKEIMQLDPTRPVMVDGGHALTDQSLPVNGCHYVEQPPREYPDEAYTLYTLYHTKGRGQWNYATNKPGFLGESFFANGHPPAWYAAFIGEKAFLGRQAARDGVGLFAKILSEGYRWAGLAAFHFWFGGESDMHYNSWQPVCVFCRQWNWSFAAGAQVPRTLKVFNDTHSTEPIDVAWQFSVGADVVDTQTQRFDVAAGRAQEFEITLAVPEVQAVTTGELVLTCLRGGEEVYRDHKPIRVLPNDAVAAPAITAHAFFVFDPDGSARARLDARGIAYTAVDSVAKIPDDAQLVLIGCNALEGRVTTDRRWKRMAQNGTRLIVLEQDVPLHYQAVPADFEPTRIDGRIAFMEDTAHPVFTGLAQADFFTWSGDHIVYRHPYRKASRGAVSLVQCDDQLSCSALAECRLGEGVMLLCQLAVGGKLATDPVAQRLFDNMLLYAAAYAPARKSTALVMADDTPALQLLAGSGLEYDRVATLADALGGAKHDIVICRATPEHLATLAQMEPQVDAFMANGGWLMLWGLTPEGLPAFTNLVKVAHVIRPAWLERVAPPAVSDPLLAGLTARDFVMQSGEKIFPWAGDVYMADDVFSYVVDLDDIAPFCDFSNAGDPEATPRMAEYARNMVNGFVSADAWKYVHYVSNDARYTLPVPKPVRITEFAIVPNTHYNAITKLDLYVDDDTAPIELTVQPENVRQDYPIDRECTKSITLAIAGLNRTNDAITGIDNIWLTVQNNAMAEHRVVPLANIGGLVKYPRGKGGIILNQLQIQPHEAVPANAAKKQLITSTILRNLGAQFAETAEPDLLAMRFTPVPFDDLCTQYLTRDRGWLNTDRDLAHLPVGESSFDGVTYLIRDFRTSPLPACIMLSGPGARGHMPRSVTGIPVGRTADALFFLHGYHQTRDDGRRRDGASPEVLRYRVHYSDGKEEVIPVRLNEGVAHWISAEPRNLKNASVAWAGKFPQDERGDYAVLYQLQWVNPRPDVAIESIDFEHGEDAGRHGTPVLFAITTGNAETP